MALSGTVNTTGYDGRYVQLTWTATQNVENNTSTINYTVKGAGTASSSWYNAGPVQVYFGNTLVKEFNDRIRLYNGTIIGSGSRTIYHNDDGTANFTISVRAAIYFFEVRYSGSGTFTLNTISRATTPTFSASSVDMGSTVTINLPRNSSSLTHRLSYKFGSLTNQTSGLSATTGISTSATFTPPLTLANQIPNSTSGICTVTCETYSGSTLLGTKTAILTLNVPSSVIPSISAVSITEATTGIAAEFNAFIQNRSTLSVAITAAGSYGSTITKYETYIQAVPYRESSFTSALITASGTVGVVTTVTDSRGRTTQVSNSITVLAYSPPIINSMSAYRIDTSGNADEEGERIAVAMRFSISSVNGLNTRIFRLKYKSSNDNEFTQFASGTASTSYNGTQKFTSSPVISGDSAYTIRLEIQDFFETVIFEFALPTAFTLIDYRSTGKGMAFGKVSEKDALEVAMNSDFTKQVNFYSDSTGIEDGDFLRLRRKDGTLAVWVTTSTNGDGLKMNFYKNGAWISAVHVSAEGDITLPAVNYTMTPSTNYSFDRYSVSKQGNVVTICAKVNCSNTITTGVTYTFATIDSSIAPSESVTTIGVGNTTDTTAVWINSSGTIKFRPNFSSSGSSTFEFMLVYNKSATWS